MPLTLKQLEGRRDACNEKIQEIKVLTDGIGGVELGSLTFKSSGFFTGLVGMSKEEIGWIYIKRIYHFYFIFRLSSQQ